MLAIITWVAVNGAPIDGKGKGFVAYDEVYESIPAEYRSFRFTAKSSGKFVITIRFWRDGEYWQKVFNYDPGNHTIVINLEKIEDAEMLPTKGIGRKHTIINVKPLRKPVILSDIEIM